MRHWGGATVACREAPGRVSFSLSPGIGHSSLHGSMTTANKITILRILLIPFFVVEVLYCVNSGSEFHRIAALLTFAVAAICDGVDGYIARRYNQISELGTILDPLADKLLLVSAVVLLSFNHGPLVGQFPPWFAGTVIGRDLLLLIGLVVIQMTLGKVKVRPRFVGKLATVLQMASVLWVLLKWDQSAVGGWTVFVTAGAAICTGVSGLLYVYDGVRQLSSSPSSSASEPQDKQRNDGGVE
jgi:CDP-diacylglycerol--glycerol-3-phosphate 3-phosphatidyltransferase